MKILITLFLLFLLVDVFSQDENQLPKIVNDSLYTTSGYKIGEKQNIKIGSGSMPDGDFKYIRINSTSLFSYHSSDGYNTASNQANSFSRRNSGLIYKVKSLDKRGNNKHGYVYYIKFNIGMIAYEVDIENAIASGEIVVPEEFRPKPKTQIVEIKQQTSVADELVKLRKLYTDSVLTKDEYETQKKKLLEKN